MLCVCDVGHISIFVRQRARHGVKRDHRVVLAPKTARSPPARRSQESAAKFVFARGVGQARAVLLPVDGAVDGLVEVGVVAAALPRRHDAGAGAEHRPVAPRDLHAPGVQQPRHDQQHVQRAGINNRSSGSCRAYSIVGISLPLGWLPPTAVDEYALPSQEILEDLELLIAGMILMASITYNMSRDVHDNSMSSLPRALDDLLERARVGDP